MNYYVSKQKNDDFFTSLFDELFADGMKMHGMRSDLVEKEDRYILFVDLPGCKKENIRISYENEYLTISAKAEKEENLHYLHQERINKNLSRTYYVGEIKEDLIKASYLDGVLKVELFKEEPVKKEEKKIIRID